MPNVTPGYRQQEVLLPGRYMLRHIAPKQPSEGGPGIVAPLGAGFTVLGQTLYAAPLPVSRLPDSPDFHEGQYTLRMFDAGEGDLTFPNRDSSDGQPWRQRFSAAGHTEFIEISREGEVEQIIVVDKVDKDRQKVMITGYDGLFLSKKNFEQDYTAVIAPRDLIERSSGLYVTTLSEFGAGLSANTFASSIKGIWSLRDGFTGTGGMSLRATDGASNSIRLAANASSALLEVKDNGLVLRQELPLPTGLSTTPHTLLMECDGRWVRGFLDGVLVGILPVASVSGWQPKAEVVFGEGSGFGSAQGIAKERKPFLMRGSEKGDYVLPGAVSNTYPTGGLHGRYIVNGATTTGEEWWQTILAPDPRRTGFPTYIEDQQPTINHNKPSGIPETYFAARWFGSIYLPLSKGDATLAFQRGGKNIAYRVWIGKTQMGAQIDDNWSMTAETKPGLTVSAAAMGGKDGWYPIVIELAVGETNPGWAFFLINVAATYTDPGGTVINKGESPVVPATSLSPLGCVDARIQGTSFFDLIQETAKNYGYQLRAEPRQLESGEFPCAIVPKARVGIETDEIIEPDDMDRKSGINNYKVTEDATDSACSVKAFGTGIADGKGSQIAFEAVSLADQAASLYDMQAWVAAGDIAFPALLAARANAELAVRLGVWQNIEGEPLARDRLADTFPLTGVLSQFRWRPGDGVRLWLPDGGVFDSANRQLMQIVRSFSPEGRTNTQVGFRPRPKDPLYAVRTALRDATRPSRAYQKQYKSRDGGFSQIIPLKAATAAGLSIVTLQPGEAIVDARVVLSLVTKPVKILINSVDRTVALGGPWSSPTTINILPYCLPFAATTQQRLYVQLEGGAEEQPEVDFQLLTTLLV
jgi:hypothetical protein